MRLQGIRQLAELLMTARQFAGGVARLIEMARDLHHLLAEREIGARAGLDLLARERGELASERLDAGLRGGHRRFKSRGIGSERNEDVRTCHGC